MGSFVGVNSLNVHHHLDGMVLEQDTIASHDVASHGGYFSAVGCTGGFCHSNSTDSHLAFVVQSRDLHDHKNALLNESHTFY